MQKLVFLAAIVAIFAMSALMTVPAAQQAQAGTSEREGLKARVASKIRIRISPAAVKQAIQKACRGAVIAPDKKSPAGVKRPLKKS